jgi:hypothetical protein
MTKEEVTTVQLKKSVVRELKSIKKYPRQTYDEIIEELINIVKSTPKKKHIDEYDEFLYKIQQAKMKELWDNEYDDVWEHA